MSTWIAVMSPKGGVGKTTISLNLAVTFARRGNRTLLVDTDPQGGINLSLAKENSDFIGIWDGLEEQVELENLLTPTKLLGLTLLTKGTVPAWEIKNYEDRFDKTEFVGKLRRQFENQFDVVILDTPAGLGSVTNQCIRHVDYALVASQAESLSFRSLQQASDLISHIQKSHNPELNFLGILPTMVDKSSDTSLNVLTQMWSKLGHVLDTSIPRSDLFLQASQKGVPLSMMSGSDFPEARRFDILASELEERIASFNSDFTNTLESLL